MFDLGDRGVGFGACEQQSLGGDNRVPYCKDLNKSAINFRGVVARAEGEVGTDCGMQMRYSFSERLEKEWANLTIYSEDAEFLEQLIVSLSKQVDFQRASLYEDIRAGTARIRKLKQEQQKNYNGNYTGKTTYSLDKTPQIFIRRAVPSDDEEEDRPRGKNSGGKKKYKEVSKEVVNAPKFSNDDFPTLT